MPSPLQRPDLSKTMPTFWTLSSLPEPSAGQLADRVVGAIVIVPNWQLASRPRMINW